MATSEGELRSKLFNYLNAQGIFKGHGKVVDLNEIAQGWETEIYSFSLEREVDYETHTKDLVLRMYNGDGAEGKSLKEFKAMAKLHELKFPTAKVYHLEPNRSVLGKPFVIMEKIDGQSMGKIIETSPSKTGEEMVRLFCRMFVDLHRMDIEPFLSDRLLFPDTSYYDTAEHNMNNLMNNARQTLAQFGNTKFDQVLDWIEQNKETVSRGRLSSIHLDYHFYNVLIRSDGKPFVIDWTNFDIMDYRMDVAWSLLLASTYGNPEARGDILRTYEDIAGNKVEDIEYFEVLAAARRLFSISISLSMGPEKLGMRPEAIEMMKRGDHIKGVIKVLRDRTGITFRGFDDLIK